MRRSGFKRKPYERKPSPLIGMAPGSTAHVRQAPVTARCVVAPKSQPVRHEGYRRLVAAMPCKRCEVTGYGQAAHSNTGKGLALKACDLETFCLCADRPGVVGCHTLFDQGAIYTKPERRALEIRWSAETRAEILNSGQCPPELVELLPDEEQTA